MTISQRERDHRGPARSQGRGCRVPSRVLGEAEVRASVLNTQMCSLKRCLLLRFRADRDRDRGFKELNAVLLMTAKEAQVAAGD